MSLSDVPWSATEIEYAIELEKELGHGQSVHAFRHMWNRTQPNAWGQRFWENRNEQIILFRNSGKTQAEANRGQQEPTGEPRDRPGAALEVACSSRSAIRQSGADSGLGSPLQA